MSEPTLTLVAPPPPPPAPPASPRRRWPALAAVLVAATVVVGAVGALAVRRGGDGAPASTGAAVAFLDRYLDDEGRVVRADEGGDTVSEGQAYAMLLAQATGDRDRFDRAWTWARENLQRDDGLLAWHWADGVVTDPMPATDADLDAAWALALAAERFGDEGYEDEARRMADAILEAETVVVAGRRVLVAGPWAATTPAVVNPSYVSPGAFATLRRVTGDDRWSALARDSRDGIDRLLDGGLPPDWAVVAPDGTVRAVAGPDDRTGPGAYGLDAARLLIRLGGSCGAADRALAGRAWERLEPLGAGRAAESLALDGRVVVGRSHAATAMASAAAAAAAGDRSASDSLVAEAERIDRDHPTYYGAAWVALGQLLLDGRLGC